MTSDTQKAEAVEQLLETPDLASALESEQFKKFLKVTPYQFKQKNNVY